MPTTAGKAPSTTSVLVIEEKLNKSTSNFSRKKNSEKSSTLVTLSTNQIVTDEEICLKLLVDGFVQSYVDFYNLSHRIDPNSDEGNNSKISIKGEDMVYIRDLLVQAEISRRQGNTTIVFTSYKKLSDFYCDRYDWRTSIFFLEKYLEIAQLTNDTRAIMSVNHELGCVYQKMGDYTVARNCHERHEKIATNVELIDEIAKANSELYKVYSHLATLAELKNGFEEALELYQLALSSAKKCWDKSSEGEANGKIGSLLLQRNQAEESLPYLMQQSDIAADMGFAEGRCRACSSLALAYDLLNKPEKALHELKLVHSISEQAGDLYLQSQACKALGSLYSKIGKLQEASDTLEKHFNLLKSLQKQTNVGNDAHYPAITNIDIDLARANFGISKGNLCFGRYLVAIQLDITSLLDWKLMRSEIVDTK